MSDVPQVGILPDPPEMDAAPSLVFRVQSDEPISSMPILDSAELGRLRVTAALIKLTKGFDGPLVRLALAEDLRRALAEFNPRNPG
jgi:hypothetical protein